jgi:hypothetical protein
VSEKCLGLIRDLRWVLTKSECDKNCDKFKRLNQLCVGFILPHKRCGWEWPICDATQLIPSLVGMILDYLVCEPFTNLIGTRLQTESLGGDWFDSVVIDISPDAEQVKVHFLGWPCKFDDWVKIHPEAGSIVTRLTKTTTCPPGRISLQTCGQRYVKQGFDEEVVHETLVILGPQAQESAVLEMLHQVAKEHAQETAKLEAFNQSTKEATAEFIKNIISQRQLVL